MNTTTPRLHPDDLAAILRGMAAIEHAVYRLAEALKAPHPRTSMRLVDVAEAADMLSVSPEWVRDHAADLGAVRLRDGARSPLRFDPEQLRAYVTARRIAKPAPVAPKRRPGPSRGQAWAESIIPLPKEMRR
jgi:hypothetical protein